MRFTKKQLREAQNEAVAELELLLEQQRDDSLAEQQKSAWWSGVFGAYCFVLGGIVVYWVTQWKYM